MDDLSSLGPLYTGKTRPRRDDPVIIETAARAVLPDVMAWLSNDVPDDARERASYEAEVMADLIDAIKVGDEDAYAMAKRLDDRHGWSPDGALTDILEGVDVWTPHSALVRGWVLANGIKPNRSAGDRVNHKRWGAGAIVRVQADDATYVVLFDVDSPKTAKGYVGTILTFEEIDT